MRNLLVLALALPLAACTVGDTTEEPDPGNTNEHPNEGSGSGSAGSGSGDGVSGDITADVTWSGATRIKGSTTIKAGATVTVEPGTTLTFASGAGILVEGTLAVNGTKAATVSLSPEASFWSGIEVTGTYNLTYGLQKGGSIRMRAGSNVTIVDSKLWGASGDYIIANGGNLDMSYSNVGADPGVTDTTHCQLHFNSGVGTIKINNSNINSAPFGLMYYGGVNADFRNNNWFGNGIDVDTQPGAPVSGDFSGSYFDEAPPTPANGSTLTLTNISTTKLVAGPR